jgi:uncharacterized protein YnzC (UPF0291/DUF896 family)
MYTAQIKVEVVLKIHIWDTLDESEDVTPTKLHHVNILQVIVLRLLLQTA